MAILDGDRRAGTLPTLVVVLGAWTAVWWVTVGLALGRQLLRGEAISPGGALTADLPLLLLWCAATPLILASGRRWPPSPGWRSLLPHVGAGVAFVVLSNLAIRVPLLVREGAASFGREAGMGLIQYLGPGLLLYLGIVWLGAHRRAPEALDGRGAAGEGPLALRGPLRTHLLRPGEIQWIEADNNHVRVHLADGRRVRVRRRLAELDEALEPRGFVRIHRSTLVRLEAIREVQPLGKGDMVAVLRNGTELRVARSRRDALTSVLGVRL